uniref:Peptidase M12B domain-containing protein n=1 Tax=Amblyomma maculatum TaxID=34609 RepID=G3MLN2_AMBMU
MLLAALFVCFGLCCCAAEKELAVYPKIVQERTTTESLVLRLTDEITLNLQKSTVLADKLLIVTSSEDGNQVETVDTSAIEENLYHDTHHRSSLMVQQRDGAVQVEGVINSKLRIKPLPQAERSLNGQILHSIYEVQEINDDIVRMEPRLKSSYWRDYDDYDYWPNFAPTTTTRKPRTNIDTFVVEIHIVSDKEHHKHFATNEELIAYMAVMTNAVNLRYLDMTRPKITFKLVGITRNTDDAFAHVIHNTLEAVRTLEGLVKYYQQGKIPGNPDAIYLITNRDLSSIENGVLEKGVAGLAYLGKLCTKLAAAEGEDIAGSYKGVYPMAHELAHILGAEHDNTPKCPWSAGYLMSYVDGGTNKYRLSSCSEQQIRTTVQSASDACLRETSRTNYMNQHKQMPGRKITEAMYCQRMLREYGRYKITVQKPQHLAKKCKMNCCFQIGYRIWCQDVDILEGMKCGQQKTCRRGVCGIHKWTAK